MQCSCFICTLDEILKGVSFFTIALINITENKDKKASSLSVKHKLHVRVVEWFCEKMFLQNSQENTYNELHVLVTLQT